MSLHNRSAQARRARAEGADSSSTAPRRSRLLLLAVPFLAMLAISVGMPASALAADGTISGTVTAGGAPANNIDVAVYDSAYDNIASGTVTGGTYTISSVPEGVYYVQFTDPSGTYATQWYNDEPTIENADPVTVPSGGTAANINAALTAGGQITGTVTDASTGSPLTTGDVGVYDQQGNVLGFATIGSTGTYDVTGLPSGSFKVEFDGGSGYTFSYYGGAVALEDGANVAVTQGATTPSINGSVEPDANASTISGTVTNGSGVPESGVSVELFDTNGNVVYDANGTSDANTFANTGPDGTYTLSDIPAGTYKVEFYPEFGNLGFQFYDNATTLATATPVNAPSGSAATNINAALTGGGKVSGTVTDETTGDAVPDVAVALVDSSGNVLDESYTNASGVYTISGVPTGTYDVEFLPFDAIGPGSKEYAVQYWADADTLVQATAVSVTAGATTTGINAALVTSGAEAPAQVINTITVTKTIVQTPPTVSGSVKVSKKGKATVKFTAKAGKNAPALKSLTLKLPGGLSFNSKKLKKALKVTGAKYSEKVSKGSLTVTLKSSATKVSVSISSKGLKVSKALAKKAKKGTEGALTAHVSVKDAANATTKLTF